MICSIRKGGRAGQSILFLLALFALPGLIACGTGMQASKPASPAAPAAAKAAASPALTSLEAKDMVDAIRVSMATNKPVQFNVFRLQDPVRLVVDVRGAGAGSFAKEQKVGLSPVVSIKSVAPEGDDKTAPASRFEILLDPLTTYQIVTSETTLAIDFAKPAAATAPAAAQAAPKDSVAPTTVAKAAPKAGMAPNPTVSGVKVDKEGEGYLITLSGDGALDFQTVMPDATTLIIDILGAESQVWPAQLDPGVKLIKSIRVAQILQPEKKVRVISELTAPVTYEVSSSGSQIFIHLGNGKSASAAAGEVEGPTLRDLYFKPEEGIWKIVLSGDRELKADVIPSNDPLVFMLGFEGATVAPETPQELDLSPLNDVVRNVSLEAMDEPVRMVRLTMKLARAVPYQVVQSGQQIYININRDGKTAAASLAQFAVTAVEAASPSVSAENTVEEDISALFTEKKKAYTGEAITLDLKDADIREVLRIISEISGINFVSGSDVAGSVTIRLKDVPWDQALDIILKTNEPPLTGQMEAENIMRIATVTKIDKESREKQVKLDSLLKEREQKKMLEPLLTRSFRISYAKASDLAGKMGEFKSKDPNAFVKVDERTNIMIVRDRAKNLEEIQSIVDTLDQPEPAVKIEARIVEVKDTAGEEIGIQWGANKFNDAAHGNALNYSFPNSMQVGGGIQSTAGSSTASGNPLAVSLPITNATAGGALALSLGSIADTFSLDIKLQAMETLNKVKIISNPSILIVQNQKARIHVGEQIPYTETDKEGNTVIKWKDVGVTLEVTPQITAEGSVFLDLLVKKDSRGDSVVTGGKEDIAIDAKEAETKVLLRDGETGVIGGLYTTETTKKSSAVPGLSKIPFLGALFRSRNDSESRNELLIFLTPKIIKNTRGASSVSAN